MSEQELIKLLKESDNFKWRIAIMACCIIVLSISGGVL